MRHRRRSTLTGAVVGIVALIAAFFGISRTRPQPFTPPPAPGPSQPLLKPSAAAPSLIPPGCEQVTVKRAVDGDTVELSDGRKVRYLGIDTPEHNEPFFNEAKQFNANLVEGRTVWLEFDIEKTDKYGRTLAFLWIKEGGERMVNAEILRAGFARVYTPGPDAKHKDALLACQREARENKRGSWENYVFAPGMFLTTKNGHAFHKKGCENLKDGVPTKTWTSRDEVMDAGFSPCRTCKP